MRLVNNILLLAFITALSGCVHSRKINSNFAEEICAAGYSNLDVVHSAVFDVVWNQHGPFIYFLECPDKAFPASIKLTDPEENLAGMEFISKYDSMALNQSQSINVNGLIKITKSRNVSPFTISIIKVVNFETVDYRGPTF